LRLDWQLFAGALIALLGAWLYRVWVMRPILDEVSLGAAYAVGLTVGAVIGIVSSLVIRHSVIMSVAAMAATVGGHAWAIVSTTDIHATVLASIPEAVRQMRYYHLVLIAVVTSSCWVGGNMMRRRAPSAPPSHG
jgi:hypothetical protein